MDKAKVIVLRGVLNYAKVLGKPRPHTGLPKYDKGPYWSLDLTPDAKSMELVEAMDLEGKLRPKKKEKVKPDPNRVGTGKYLSFKILEKNADGEKNSPPRIVDARGNEWDGSLIGNGTVADVKVKVVDYGAAEKGAYMQAIRILDHVPYESSDFDELDEDDEYFAKPEKAQDVTAEEADEPAEDDDLDDDIPF